MARIIDVSNPEELSVLDRKYLQDRCKLPAGAEPVTEDELLNFNRPEPVTEPEPEPDQDDQDELPTDYESMTKAELVEEIEDRNERIVQSGDYEDDELLSTSGTKADLIEQLLLDDQSREA